MKHTSRFLFVAALVGMSTLGCTAENHASTATRKDDASFDLSATRKIINEKNARFTNAHVIGDSVGMMDIFTDDARVLAPNADPVTGREAIEVMTSEYLKFGITEFREETTAFYGNEDLLIDQGNYVMVYGPEKTTEHGKYLNVWRQVNGEWKIYSNMWNTNAAVASVK